MHLTADSQISLVPLYLGITGHQDVRDSDKPQLKQLIINIIEEKKVQCPHTPVIILTPLAEGADRLAAYAAIECGIQYVVPLPMPVDEYRKDFITPESLNEFNDLLLKAEHWFELPMPEGTTINDLQQKKDQRDEQYFQNGLFIARQSHMLIALWDGMDSEKRGGTAHIIKLQKQGLPSSHPQLQQRLQNLQSGPIYHIVTPRAGSTLPAEAFSARMVYSDYWQNEEKQPMDLDRQILKNLDDYNSDTLRLFTRLRDEIVQSEEQLLKGNGTFKSTADIQNIARYFATTDILATYFKRRRFFAFKLLLILVVVACFAFFIHMKILQTYVLPVLYSILVSTGTIWFVISNKKKYTRKHEDYRALSEAFRIQYYLSVAQKKINVSEHYLQKYQSELGWRIYALRAALIQGRTDNTIELTDVNECNIGDCTYIKEYWVSDQLEYYKRSARRYHGYHKRLRNTGNILLMISVLTGVLLFWLEYFSPSFMLYPAHAGHFVFDFLAVCTPGILVLSAVFHVYNQKMAFAKTSSTFQRMSQLFRVAGEKLNMALESGNPKEAVEIIRELAHESMMENLEAHQHELQVINTLFEEQKEELFRQKQELQATLEDLHKTQAQLIESEKMAALGGLVAGVAHEINTPVGIGITAITSLLNDVDKMAGLYEKNEISRKDFREFLQSTSNTGELIQKNLDRTARLVQSFKQVSVDQVSEQQRVFILKEYIEDILSGLRPEFRDKDINIEIFCDDQLEMHSYPGAYAQIFTNLILNSLQHGFAGKETGKITIQAVKNTDHLNIEYRDNGSGIQKKDLPRIFEPFYTSDQHRGTGLGLNIIYNLVTQKLHGTISCESETGRGVVFRIVVPV